MEKLTFILLLFTVTLVMAQQPGRVIDPTSTNQFGGSNFTNDSILFEDSEDDVVYTFESSEYSNAEDLKYNELKWSLIDTSLVNRHRYEMVEKQNYTYHNLGNVGTPLNPVFYQVPDIIGTRLGLTSLDLFYERKPLRFYNSVAPLTKLGIILGGNGRTQVDVEFSRNVNERWNVFTNYRNINADKQIGANRNRGDRMISSTYYHYGSYFTSKDEKYTVLASFKRINHIINEVGGLVEDSVELIDFTDVERADVNMQNVRSREFRYDIQGYQQYALSKLFTPYHEMNFSRRERHFDITNNALATIYENPLFIEDSTVDQTNFISWYQEIGVKGDLSNLFYQAYGRLRGFNLNTKYLPRQTGLEVYAGGRIRYDWREQYAIEAGLDYLFFDRYKLYGQIKSGLLEASVISMIYSPGLIEQQYFGNYAYWNNQLAASTLNEIQGAVNVRFLNQLIKPTVKLTNIFQPVFWNVAGTPEQSSGAAQFVMPGLEMNFHFGEKVHLKASAHYNLLAGSAGDVFRIPDYMGWFQTYFQDIWFNNSLELQVGFEGHYKAAYFADAYNPMLQNFILQNEFTTENFLDANFFLNFKIQQAICFFKITNFSQLATGEGYFVTPRYPVQATTFDFGVEWYLFN